MWARALTQSQRTAIYKAARSTGAWGYVEPLSQTPTWVHFDRRYGTPACSGTTAGYPTLRRGSRGCYVMILQDALSTLGYQSTFLVVPLVLAPAYIGLDTQSPAFYFVHKVSEFLPVLFGDKSTSYVQLNQSALFATHLLKSFLYFSRSLKYQFQSSALLPV